MDKLKDQTLKFINDIQRGERVEENKQKMVSLWKGLEKEDSPSENDVFIFKKPFKGSEETVLFLLVHHLNENLKGFQEEYERRGGSRVDFLKKCVEDHCTFLRILKEVEGGEYKSLEEFIKKEEVGDTLKFYYSILQFVNSQGVRERVRVLLREVKKCVIREGCNKEECKGRCSREDYKRVCKKYLKLLIFDTKDNKDDRNTKDTTLLPSLPTLTSLLKDLFIKEYSRLNLFNDYDFLRDILRVGTSSFYQLKGVDTPNLDEEENVLPVGIKLPKGYNYHSLFVCPVLKGLCEGENKPVLLKCNHVISYNAAKVLSNFRSTDSFKCPYCPEMCKFKDILVIEL